MTGYMKTLQNIIVANNIKDSVVWAGSLPEQEMHWCYKNCLTFAMTSRVESFGIIATEAMAAGCVCISANNSCLPEIFADAATFYTPGNHIQLAETIIKTLNFSDGQSDQVSQKALKRSKFFSWDICAERTVAQLIRAVEDSRV